MGRRSPGGSDLDHVPARKTFRSALPAVRYDHITPELLARLPIDVVADHPLLAGLGPDPVVRHAHEVPTLPAGFTNLASTAITEIQMAVDDDGGSSAPDSTPSATPTSTRPGAS